MRNFKITHRFGTSEKVEARDLLDAVFSYRGNTGSIISVVEVIPESKVEQIPNKSNEEFEDYLDKLKHKFNGNLPPDIIYPTYRSFNSPIRDEDFQEEYDFERFKDD